MKNVAITILRQKLSAYLADVERGETLRVTVHGRAIAEISPPAPSKDDVRVIRARLRNSLLRYDKPLEPANAIDDWDMNQ